MNEDYNSINRRKFVAQTALGLTTAATISHFNVDAAFADADPHQAMGTRTGEVTDNSAIIWVRLTTASVRNNAGKLIPGRVKQGAERPAITVPVDQLEGACSGAPGNVRLRYGIKMDLSDAKSTDWVEVNEKTDFSHRFLVNDLNPATTYYFVSETQGLDKKTHGGFTGKFQTAPTSNVSTDLTFCVMTCQGYPDRGHPDGHSIYPSMLALKPAFTCLTGDLVYYDNDEPYVTSPELARYHWQRMFSLPRLIDFNRQVGTYWLKDDHDTLNNDSGPESKSMGSFTFAEGQKIFRQQAPMGDGLNYRTFRWGSDLQIWFTDGRDFRSKNKVPDGPDKTIWGNEQKAWFKRTVKESNATWKILVTPTPLVGPDRSNKSDNHSNLKFKHEGDEIRNWLRANVPDNFFSICGDRHWQYHSVHPESKVHEFSVGAASDLHAGGSKGNDPAYHRFHRVKGGFLSATVKREGLKSSIVFQHRDVDGKVVYEFGSQRDASI